MFDIKFVERRLTMSLKKDHEHMQDYNGFNLQVCNYWHEINNFLTEYYFGIPHANGSATLYSEHFFEDKAREGMINYNDMMGTDYFSLEERFTLRYGQPAYISWLIQNVNYFSLLPSDLNLLEELEINNFLGIWVKRINEHNFLPTPAFTKRKEKFPEHIKALNEKKWELFQSQMINNASNDNFEDNKSGSKYSYSDGYGGFVSDNFIDDVLDGEADAYWNLD